MSILASPPAFNSRSHPTRSHRTSTLPTPPPSLHFHPPFLNLIPPIHFPAHQPFSPLLSRLASQHPMSDYNQVKHGQYGSPNKYTPISIQARFHVLELRARQALAEDAPWYYPAPSPDNHPPTPTPAQQAHRADSCVIMPPATPEELTAEFESLSIDAMAGRFPESNVPGQPPPFPDGLQVPEGILVSRPSARPVPLGCPRPSHPTFASLPSALIDAISTPLFPPEGTPTTTPSTDALMHYPWLFDPTPALVAGSRVDNSPEALLAVKTSDTHPINISFLIPTELLPLLSAHLPSDVSLPCLPPHLTLLPLLTLPAPPPPQPASPSRLGNLFLSSCPGKKVRLAGPVKGRGGICRDLAADLRRMRDDAGVACIICCLDDDELAFLGTTFPDYAATAASLGLTLIRVPMPEGLAPLSPAVLHARLSIALREFTLKGKHVLAHCRGGVGRAGLVACCWAMMLGLVSTSPYHDPESPKGVPPALVEAIRLVRRRRSVKAIETYEQVCFLRDFLFYVRAHNTVTHNNTHNTNSSLNNYPIFNTNSSIDTNTFITTPTQSESDS